MRPSMTVFGDLLRTASSTGERPSSSPAGLAVDNRTRGKTNRALPYLIAQAGG